MANGACQFAALAGAVRWALHVPASARGVREDVCNFLALPENNDWFRPFLSGGDAGDPTACVARMRGRFFWGDGVTLKAAARVLRVTIRYWSTAPGVAGYSEVHPLPADGPPRAVLFLGHMHEVHWVYLAPEGEGDSRARRGVPRAVRK